jgi:ATP-binding cassette, subfamily B, bacterial HlyB/CyaB
MNTTVDHQVIRNNCSINAIEAINRNLEIDLDRCFIEANLCINSNNPFLCNLDNYFNNNECITQLNFLFINALKSNLSNLQCYLPCIFPIKRNSEVDYLLVECLKKGKLQIFDPSTTQTQLWDLSEFIQKANTGNYELNHSLFGNLLEEKIFQTISSYNIDLVAFQELEKEELADIITYFLYIKHCFGFANNESEKEFLKDLLFEQEINVLPKQLKVSKAKDVGLRITAPLVLTIKRKKEKHTVNRKIVNKEEFKKPYWRLFKELNAYHKLWGIYISAAIIAALFGQFTIFSSQILIDHILPDKNLNYLVLFIIALGLFKMFDLLLSLYKSFIAIHLGNMLDDYFIRSFIKKLNTLHIQYIHQFSKGDLSERMKDSLDLKSFFIRFFTFLIIDSIVGIFALMFMMFINWKITLVVVVVLIFFVCWFYLITPQIRKNEEQRFIEKSNLYSALLENIDGLQVIKSFRLEALTIQKLSPKIKRILSIQKKVRYIDLLNSGVVNFILILASILIIYLLSRVSIVEKTISIGQVITFVALSSQIFSTVGNILDENLAIQENKIILSRYFSFGNTIDNVSTTDNFGKISCFELKSLEFRKVSFHYQPTIPIISEVDFKINKGDKIILEGKNGLGKSTFCKLLSLLYAPLSGDIYVNDLRYKLYNKNALRKKILLVSNEDLLFHDTLTYNMTFGQSCNDVDILSLAREIGLLEFISNKDEGLDFVVSEQGRNLSTGQRKKILMMRAFLSDADFIILDETLSGIDQESRERIELYINNQHERSFIIISHEPLQYLKFNKVFVMHNGCIEQLQNQRV